VYNPTTLLGPRDAAGDCIGANLDPSHLLWQHVDVVTAARTLARDGALFHLHAKDTNTKTSVCRVTRPWCTPRHCCDVVWQPDHLYAVSHLRSHRFERFDGVHGH
jgi:sugar phosphate isomerase/epimerase